MYYPRLWVSLPCLVRHIPFYYDCGRIIPVSLLFRCFVKEGSAMNDYSDSDFGNNLIDSDKLWGFCEYPGLPTTGPSWMSGGSATEGQLCVFPFTYEDVEYNDCIDKDGSGNPW